VVEAVVEVFAKIRDFYMLYAVFTPKSRTFEFLALSDFGTIEVT